MSSGQSSAIAWAASRPDIPGMRMSRNSTCGRWARAASTAAAPWPTLATTRSSGQARASSACSAAASSGSSSAISAVAAITGRSPAIEGAGGSSRRPRRPARRRARGTPWRRRSSRGDGAPGRGRSGNRRAACAPASPTPLSRTLRTSASSPWVALTSRHPPSTWGSSPCLMAFSTSGWSRSGGTRRPASASGRSMRGCSRSPIRTCISCR